MSKSAPGLGERLLSLLFPARCLSCSKVIPSGGLFCPACEKERPAEPFCRRYGLPEAGAEGLRVLAPMSYQGGFRKTLYRMKFGGRRGLAAPIGRLMAEALEKDQHFDGVVWVPMTAKRRRARGYDQSELLARSVAKALGLPCLSLLEKVRETDVQHELPRKQRQKNVKNAYRADGKAAGKTLLLVDDIVTTGATMTECAQTLYRAGAAGVTGLCAADVPLTFLGEET